MKKAIKVSIAPHHLAILKKQLSAESYKKAVKLAKTEDCGAMRFTQFLSKIQ